MCYSEEQEGLPGQCPWLEADTVVKEGGNQGQTFQGAHWGLSGPVGGTWHIPCDLLAAPEENNQSPPRSKGPSSPLGSGKWGEKCFTCIVSVVPDLPGGLWGLLFHGKAICRPPHRAATVASVDWKQGHDKGQWEFWNMLFTKFQFYYKNTDGHVKTGWPSMTSQP